MKKEKKIDSAVGKKGYVAGLKDQRSGKELVFEVKILGVKRSYGRIRYLVTPVKGHGEMYVESVEY
jgi:hypothetical protein